MTSFSLLYLNLPVVQNNSYTVFLPMLNRANGLIEGDIFKIKESIHKD